MQKVCVEKKKSRQWKNGNLMRKMTQKLQNGRTKTKNPYCQKLNLKSFLTCSSLCKHCRDKNMVSEYFKISKLRIRRYFQVHEMLCELFKIVLNHPSTMACGTFDDYNKYCCLCFAPMIQFGIYFLLFCQLFLVNSFSMF